MFQTTITLRPRPRGFHLVTDEILEQLPELSEVHMGLAHIHILHTSASLTLNENADPTVRGDFERWFNETVPENAPYYHHTMEGADDMPAHIKASLLGSGVLVPVRDGSFHLGTWQGIYLGEHRERGGPRKVVVTVIEG
jgi:secondary thiamine-phosphate synthase enzyme